MDFERTLPAAMCRKMVLRLQPLTLQRSFGLGRRVHPSSSAGPAANALSMRAKRNDKAAMAFSMRVSWPAMPGGFMVSPGGGLGLAGF